MNKNEGPDTALPWLDFGTHFNPLGMTTAVKNALQGAFDAPASLPTDFADLKTDIGKRHGTAPQNVMLSHSEGRLMALLAAAAAPKVRRALLPMPCPPAYERALAFAGIPVQRLLLSAKHHFHVQRGQLSEALNGCDLLMMGNPSWPASVLIPPGDLLDELDCWLEHGGRLILDESAIDFTYGSTTNSLWSAVRREPHVAILRSFTDVLALTLCPVCYAVGGAGWIEAAQSRQFLPALSPLAQALTPVLGRLGEIRSETVEASTHMTARFASRLRRITGVRVLPHDAHFIMCRLERDDWTVARLVQALRQYRLIVPPCADDVHFSLGLHTPPETNRLIQSMRAVLMPPRD